MTATALSAPPERPALGADRDGGEFLRRNALRVLDNTVFQTTLPAGECDNATVVQYLHRRREEIVAVARIALGNYARTLTSEEVLCFLYREVPKNDLSASTA